MKNGKTFWLVGLTLAVSACGKAGNLEPRTGQSLPPPSYGQSKQQTAEVLLTPSVQARPGRSDELLRRSERRTDDPFDLPPGNEGDAGKQEGAEEQKATPTVLVPAPTTPR
jgi:hypothetical protein